MRYKYGRTFSSSALSRASTPVRAKKHSINANTGTCARCLHPQQGRRCLAPTLTYSRSRRPVPVAVVVLPFQHIISHDFYVSTLCGNHSCRQCTECFYALMPPCHARATCVRHNRTSFPLCYFIWPLKIR